jgi:hypothetical protein
VWLRKSAGKLSEEVALQAPRLPSTCPVDSLVAPAHSVAESMNHFREAIPDVDWSAWANIEPAFRAVAEWEMSIVHYKAQESKALKDWWARNNAAVRVCLNTATAIAAVSLSHPAANPRYAQIDRRVRTEQRAIDRTLAPAPVKKEALEQISDAAAAEKYAADVDEPRR